MLYYLHSYAPDAETLKLCVSRLLELDPYARIVIANDPGNPVPPAALPRGPRIEVIPTPYPLGGNLNGRAMIDGMLQTLMRVMEYYGERHIVKMDCDAWVNSVDWLRVGHFAAPGMPEPDYIGLERYEPMSAAGDCYRISIYAARAALKQMMARQWPENAKLPEDETILNLVLRSRLPVYTHPHIEGKHVGMHDNFPGKRERAAWVVHCGEVCTDGTRAPRDFVLLRMRLLAAACSNPTPEKP